MVILHKTNNSTYRTTLQNTTVFYLTFFLTHGISSFCWLAIPDIYYSLEKGLLLMIIWSLNKHQRLEPREQEHALIANHPNFNTIHRTHCSSCPMFCFRALLCLDGPASHKHRLSNSSIVA